MTEAPERKPILMPGELAKRWGVPVSQVYRLSREGVIPTVRIGRYYRYSIDAIERWEAASAEEQEQ